MVINVVDTETCGLEGGVVELAKVSINMVDLTIEDYGTWLVKPDRPISLEALATHHITEETVKDQPPIEEIVQNLNGTFFIAHNAQFDQKMLSPHCDDRPWACTWRIARHLWPDAPGYSNQVLRYYRGLDVSDMPVEAGGMAHRALYDAWVTAKLFLDMKLGHEEALIMTKKPILQKIIRFGKYRGQNWADIPKDYLAYLKRGNMEDPDTRYTIEHYLK
jgi:exodeoxyribonuclease X